MKVLFVHQGRENLGIEYLSSYLKNRGIETYLAYDPGLFGVNDNLFYIPRLEKLFSDERIILERIEKIGPDWIAFSVYTNTYQWCVRLAGTIRKSYPGIPIIFGGIHPTLTTEKVLEQDSVDFAVVGEGEECLYELITEKNQENYRFIENLAYRKNGKIIMNPVRPPVAELDELPLPDKKLFEEHFPIKEDYLILSSRGCVFNCSYCCESYWNRLYNRRYFRRRNVESILDELKIMKKRYGFREVMFNDSIFFTDEKRLERLMYEYAEEIGVKFRCFGEFCFMTPRIAQLLKLGGCYSVEFGLQTLNEKIRKETLNRTDRIDQVRKALECLDAVGIRYDVDYIFGLPGESESDHRRAAFFFNCLNYLNRVKPHNLSYFPSLKIIDIAKEMNILSDRDIESINQGLIGDFFHEMSSQNEEMRKTNDNYRTLFKFIPLLKRKHLDRLLNSSMMEKLHATPSFVILLLQVLTAIRGRDYRYIVYLKTYPFRVLRAVKNLLSLRKYDGK